MATNEATLVVLSKQDARAQGLKVYYTGKPCRRGHLSPRFVSAGGCCACAKYVLKRWRTANKQRWLDNDRRYKVDNSEYVRAQGRARYAKNPEKFVEFTRVYYRKNSEEVRRKRKLYHYKTYVEKDVRERAQDRTRRWSKENPDRALINARNAKHKRRSIPGRHSASDIRDIIKMQNGKCAYCQTSIEKQRHVDHIMPVSRGGTNDRSNLQVLCASCNLAKSNRDPVDFARMMGRLL